MTLYDLLYSKVILQAIKILVHNPMGLYLCSPDSICAAQTLSVLVSDSICENNIGMSSNKAKNVGKSL